MEETNSAQRIVNEALKGDLWETGVYKIAALRTIKKTASIMETFGKRTQGLEPSDPVEITYDELNDLMSLHVANALKSAWLYLQSIKDKADRPVTQTCTRASIANCLLEMVIRGEHPMHHCYFIPTGNQLTFWEKYTGKLMRAKRDTDIQAVNAQVVYKGDEFTYTVDEDGRYQLVAHKTSTRT